MKLRTLDNRELGPRRSVIDNLAARSRRRQFERMDLNSFLRHRRGRWQRLSELLDRIDAKGIETLGPREADEFFSLYRLTSSDLNLVQTRTANPSLIDYLERLVARAYARLSAPPAQTFFHGWWMIVRHYFPATVRAEWRLVALSTLVLTAGTLFGLFATLGRPPVADIFLPAEHLEEAPAERVARLEKAEREGHRSIVSADQHAAFTVFLFNNNIRVGILGFALGLTFGVGTLIVLFYNGAMLGSLAALYFLDGQGTFFIAWVGPHGSIELPCVIFASTAGLMLAQRQLRRGHGTFRQQVREARPTLVDLLVGASTLLVIAGCVEGGFSQINEPTIRYWLKIAVAIFIFAALISYLFLMPVRPRPSRIEAPVAEDAPRGRIRKSRAV